MFRNLPGDVSQTRASYCYHYRMIAKNCLLFFVNETKENSRKVLHGEMR
jgi:hypothetical protein